MTRSSCRLFPGGLRYLAARKDPVFDAVKYRNAYRDAARHAHLPLAEEFGTFLFDATPRAFKTPLFERFRQAHYSHEMIYELPYTIAEGLAAKHGIPREQFLHHIAGRMTTQEKLRLQQSAARQKKAPDLGVDLGRPPIRSRYRPKAGAIWARCCWMRWLGSRSKSLSFPTVSTMRPRTARRK